MQSILKRGKNTSVLKFTVTYHMTSEEEGNNHFRQPSDVTHNLDTELALAYKTLATRQCLYKIPYNLVFQTLWDGT